MYDQIRVIEPGRYRVFRQEEEKKKCKGSSHTPLHLINPTLRRSMNWLNLASLLLDQIPLVTIYANKTDTMTSKPPLLDIAHLNLAHYQRQADLIHSLHIASQPMLVLEGWDDQTKDMAISVNYAMATQPGNKVYYVEPASSAFEAQTSEIQELQQQMGTLGISTLEPAKICR